MWLDHGSLAPGGGGVSPVQYSHVTKNESVAYRLRATRSAMPVQSAALAKSGRDARELMIVILIGYDPMPSDSQTTPQDTVGALYLEHHDWLRHWLRKRMACAETAADLAHDTFVRLLASRRAFDLRQPRAYLSSVARSILIDSYRRRTLEQAYLETLAAQPEGVEVSAETRAIILETLVQIDAMLDGLGPRTRTIFLLAQLDGLTYVEIARRMDLSLTTVKKHAARALTHVLLHMEG